MRLALITFDQDQIGRREAHQDLGKHWFLLLGQAEFDRDNYQCRRENTHQVFTMVGGVANGGPANCASDASRKFRAIWAS